MRKLYYLVFILFLTTEIFPQHKIGKYTVDQWRYIIDTTWGVGPSTETKLATFDHFWNVIDAQYAGFRNIEDKWQQLKSYRDTVALGVSRGRFQGIMNHLVKSLHDGHVWMRDNGIASTQLEPGVPLFFPAAITYPTYGWDLGKHFGAALAPLPDSTVFVYSAVPNHPLGLMPGDIILGYDGMLWKDIYRDLMEIQFPIPMFYISAGAERAATYQWLQAAGMNWHLFDTIDIVKYATGDTIHLSTDLLSTPMSDFRVTEQLPIDGVSFPAGGEDLVSWGYINGTKVGYIYLWGWTYASNSQDFLNAVNELMPDSSSDALIIDVRFNEGSVGGSPDAGFQRLFNKRLEPFRWAYRTNSTNHLALSDAGQNWFTLTYLDKQLYDRPIAVLCGPAAISGGDMTVQCLRHHPMVRTFGLPTNGSFGNTFQLGGFPAEWFSWLAPMVCYIPPDINNDLNHKSIPVDEEVWLTRDGVSKGEDDVVKKALEWINNLVYGHKLTLNKTYANPGIDTIKISAIIENPNSHQVSSKVYIENIEGNFIDSLELNKEGRTWTVNYLSPAAEDIYTISLRAEDIDDSKIWTTENISQFTTIGPVTLDSITITPKSNYFSVIPFLKNGSNNVITNASVKLFSNDPWFAGVNPLVRNLPNINPDSMVSPSSPFSVGIIDSLFPGYINFKVEVMSDGWTYWIDSIEVNVTGVDDKSIQPLAYRLEQNYPNPFNPSTTIKFVIPKSSFVNLAVYDVLGKEVATLVNEEKPAGSYKVTWNADRLSSGVYFFQLKASSYVETKKMILLR